jgi:hypothetical protein
MAEDKPYTIFMPSGRTKYYYRFRHQSTAHSTRTSDREKAEAYVKNLAYGVPQEEPEPTLAEFTKTMFVWGKCSWVKRTHAKGKRLEEANVANRRGFLLNHIVPKSGTRYMSTLRPKEIEDWLLDLNYSNSTRNQILFTMRRVLEEANRAGFVEINVAQSIDQSAGKGRERDAFTPEDLVRLFPKSQVEFERIWGCLEVGVMPYLSLATGARHGELRALKRKNFTVTEKGTAEQRSRLDSVRESSKHSVTIGDITLISEEVDVTEIAPVIADTLLGTITDLEYGLGQLAHCNAPNSSYDGSIDVERGIRIASELAVLRQRMTR